MLELRPKFEGYKTLTIKTLRCFAQSQSDLRPARMASQGIQILGIMLAMIGWLGTIITCGMPMWRVTAFVGANIVTAQIIWEGLWMSCVVQSTGQMQCKVYDSMLALSQDLQASRAMVVISIMAGRLWIPDGCGWRKVHQLLGGRVAKAEHASFQGWF